jgi:alpha-1,6-mannosyltransferase
MNRDEATRRAAARTRAERFGWPQAVTGFLRAHGLLGGAPVIARQHQPLRPAVPVVGSSRATA